jgi:hypothetical protein
MIITVDKGAAAEDDPRGLNLMELPLETLLHVLSFLPMDDILEFAFVCRRAFEVAKCLTWERLHFSSGHYWLEDVVNFCNRAQPTCQSLELPTNFPRDW